MDPTNFNKMARYGWSQRPSVSINVVKRQSPLHEDNTGGGASVYLSRYDCLRRVTKNKSTLLHAGNLQLTLVAEG